MKKSRKRENSDSEAPKHKKAKKSSSSEDGGSSSGSESEDIEPLKATLAKEVQRILKDRLGVTMTR